MVKKTFNPPVLQAVRLDLGYSICEVASNNGYYDDGDNYYDDGSTNENGDY